MPSTLTNPTKSSSRPEKGQQNTQLIDNTTDVQLQYSWAFVNGSKRLLNINVQIDSNGDIWVGSSINPYQAPPQNVSRFILRMQAFSNAVRSRSLINKRTLSRQERLTLSIFFLENILKNPKLKNVLSKNNVRLLKESERLRKEAQLKN